MGSTDNETIPILSGEPPKDLVVVSLDEIKRIAHELALMRHLHHKIGRLHGQVAGLYQRLAKKN